MSEEYYASVEINEKVVGYAIGYQQTFDIRYIYGIHDALLPISKQMVHGVIRSAGLGKDIADDMIQDAYLRLPDAVLGWSWDRTPVFVTYWRKVLRNFLISKYSKQWRHPPIPEGSERSYRDGSHAKLELKELECQLLVRIDSWENEKHKDIARAVLYERVFQLEDEQTLQKDIAARFHVHSAIISMWECWMRKTIAAEY